MCRDQSRPIATESRQARQNRRAQARLSTPQHASARPNRRAQARLSTPQRDRIATESSESDDRIDAPIAIESRNRDRIDAPITTESTRQSRPNRRAKHAAARLSTTNHDQSRPIATNRDRIDSIESRNRDQSRPNRLDRIEKSRPNRPNRLDRIEKSRPNRPNRTTPLHPFLSGERNSILVLSIFSPYTALFYKSLVKKKGGWCWVVRSSFSQFFFALVEGGVG